MSAGGEEAEALADAAGTEGNTAGRHDHDDISHCERCHPGHREQSGRRPVIITRRAPR